MIKPVRFNLNKIGKDCQCFSRKKPKPLRQFLGSGNFLKFIGSIF